ncbi:MAG TPA: SPASM domain-containing protein [Xanthobacteraceae bacterium]|jgi:uncharacterized protein|nr:SPASM domain-containing protein [Xanthobacteraceae bacterium]
MRRVGAIRGEPAAPMFHRFRSAGGEHVLIVPYSRVYDLIPDAAGLFDRQSQERDALVEELMLPAAGEVALADIVAPQAQSISLNVSSSCNLSCSYCYAARGGFDGAQAGPMTWQTAKAAIDALLARADPDAPITIGFLGGEPFANRVLLHTCVEYGREQSRRSGLDIRYSVTTNGTLLQAKDIALLRSCRFAVTVSIDGGAIVQDRQRPAAGKTATSSFARLRQAVKPLLADPGSAQIAARATVTRSDLDLPQRFADILALGFLEVGFAPLRMDKDRGDALRDDDWPTYLEALKRVAQSEIAGFRTGNPIRLTNLAIALKQIARGASSPYPCGAGGGYFSVAADGNWYACHRAIGAPDFKMGDSSGLDEMRRNAFLAERHVHAQAECRSCWARYLCSGACHQEASKRNRSACDFIRGWLEFCLGAYCEMSTPLDRKPDQLPERGLQ